MSTDRSILDLSFDELIQLPIDDAAVTLRIQAAILRAGGCSAWAKEVGITKSYAHDLQHGRRSASDRILAALGLERVQTEQLYREIQK
jgi:hypothetical protein